MSKTNVEEFVIKRKKKTPEEIQEENDSLMAVFGSPEKEKKEEKKLDPEVLQKLKEKQKAKDAEKEVENEMDLVDKQEVSINVAVVGVGQAGSRLAERFFHAGYDVGVINTSSQDLKFIDVPDTNKLLLEGSLGGTGKDLDLSRDIFNDNVDTVRSFVNDVIEGCDMAFTAVSLGGGTGSGSTDIMIPLLFETGLPVGVICVLPKATEDPQSKKNTVETLSRLGRMAADDMISTLIVVDNARIEQIYGGLSQADFWKVSNNAIVDPIILFNKLTAQPSEFTSLDPSDFGKIISCGDCSIYGVVEVEDYMEETGLAEAVISSLSGNMLAEGFDLTQTRTGGVIITGSEDVLKQIPAVNIDYCYHMISEQTGNANVFPGIYKDNTLGDKVRIYSWFAGLGLPQDRVENLKKESKAQAAIAAEKENNRTANMTLDLEDNSVGTVQAQIHRKIKSKKSGFGKLQGGAKRASSILDKRRKR